MYKKKGQISENVGAIITLIVGVGVAALVLIFVGTLGGSVFNMVEDKIAYNDGNADCNIALGDCFYNPDGISNYNIATNVREAITSGFEAVETSGQYLPIVVLAVIIFIVLGLVVGMGGGQRQMYGGGAL